MTYKCFELETSGGVAQIRMSRPDSLNSMIPEFWTELPLVVDALQQTEGVRVIVLSSAGRHFSAGMDFSVFQSGDNLNTTTARDRERMRRLVLKLQESFNCLNECRVPVIAAIQGGCIGAGVDMVTACDMRYASTSAYFCVQEINLAMMADLGTLQRLPRLIPDGIARELAFTGDKLSAERAKSIGFVNEVFDSEEELLKQVMEVAARIAARSPLAVSATKTAINYAGDHSMRDSLQHAADLQAAIFDGRQVQECLKAKGEKREPAFPDLHAVKVSV